MKKILRILLLINCINIVTASSDSQTIAKDQLKNLKIEATITSLLQYAASGDLKTVQLLVDSGVDCNKPEAINGATVLHNAAAGGHIQLVKWLLKNGATIDSKDKLGSTPLIWAAYHGHVDVVKYLIKNGARIGSIPHIGPSLSDASRQSGSQELRELINEKILEQSNITFDEVTYSTILEYPDFDLINSKVKIHESSFHDWEDSELEANSILKQWTNTQLTIPWTKIQLKSYVKHKMMPSRGARGLALTHVAMHDAIVLSNKSSFDSQIVTSMAVASVLGYLFPAEERYFKRVVYSLASIKYSVSRDRLNEEIKRAISMGQFIANRVIHRAQNDGAQRGWNGTRLQWYGEGRFYGPGSWEPTPPYFYYPPEEPYAPTWRTWVLTSSDQFRAKPPPYYGSLEFVNSLKEVIKVNEEITEKQLESAKFWVDGHGSVTPAGHWNELALKYVNKEMSDTLTAKIFAELNIAMADTFIAAWDSKYHYWSIRPVTAAKKLLGIEFKPPILTPPFPSYVSGHAATSGAGSQVLASYFPSNANDILQKGEQASMSRLYGGIHYRFDNDEGLYLGRKVANLVIEKYKLNNE